MKFLVGLAKATKDWPTGYWSDSGCLENHSVGCASLICLPKALIVPTRGETGNYDESDYELDANGNRTDKLKPGSEQLISYDDVDFG